MNIGSYPYGDPAYHTEQDVAENIDFENLVLATKLRLAAAIRVDGGDG